MTQIDGREFGPSQRFSVMYIRQMIGSLSFYHSFLIFEKGQESTSVPPLTHLCLRHFQHTVGLSTRKLFGNVTCILPVFLSLAAPNYWIDEFLYVFTLSCASSEDMSQISSGEYEGACNGTGPLEWHQVPSHSSRAETCKKK
jgi:hypothetical protein